MLESNKLIGKLKQEKLISGEMRSESTINGKTIAKGDPGPQGPPGKDGKDGKDGDQGAKGEKGENGISIEKIEKVSTVELVDTYRIYFSNGKFKDFIIKNGKDGQNGINGKNGIDGEQNVIEVIKVNNTDLETENKTVNIIIPTKFSDLQNDTDFATQTFVNQLHQNLKLDMINMFKDFEFSDNGSHSFYYNLKKIYKNNLSKVEIGYTDSSSLTANIKYTEISNFSGNVSTDVTGIVYIWIRLTYTDIGTIVIYKDVDDVRYSTYISDSSGGLACFTGDTEVLTEKGLKKIKDIKLKDKIKTSYGVMEVTKKYEHITDKIYKIKVGNTIIEASATHPFVTKRGIVITKNLIAGDILYNINNKKFNIDNISVLNAETFVYEINSSADNYYITNKCILVKSEKLGGFYGK